MKFRARHPRFQVSEILQALCGRSEALRRTIVHAKGNLPRQFCCDLEGRQIPIAAAMGKERRALSMGCLLSSSLQMMCILVFGKLAQLLHVFLQGNYPGRICVSIYGRHFGKYL
jgi:hypothetical protein